MHKSTTDSKTPINVVGWTSKQPYLLGSTVSRMASNSGSVCPSSSKVRSCPSDLRHDLNSCMSSFPLRSLSKYLIEQSRSMYAWFLCVCVCVCACVCMCVCVCVCACACACVWYTHLNEAINSFNCSSVTPALFLACICCSKLCSIRITSWPSWSHCCANPTVVCSVYLHTHYFLI